MKVLKTIQHTQVSSDPSCKVANSQPHGIGRVSAFDDLFLVNNLGRDISVFNNQLKKIAVFDETIFPDQDEESQFDFDAHALIIDPIGNLWYINHYGLIRVFESFTRSTRVASPIQMRPFLTSNWAGDVERFAIAWPYLLSSSPKGYSSPTAAQPGILISERLDRWLDRNKWQDAMKPIGLEQTSYLEDWGILTGFASSSMETLPSIDGARQTAAGALIAVAAGQKIGCYALVEQDDMLKPDVFLFTCEVNFAVTHMEFLTSKLIVAGPDKDAELILPGDWDEIKGGGWAAIDMAGKIVQSGNFDQSLAWGNGSEPLAVVSQENLLLGFDRQGSVYAWDLATGNKVASKILEFDGSRGIAHAVTSSGITVVGYNRDGYQLHKFVIGD